MLVLRAGAWREGREGQARGEMGILVRWNVRGVMHA
jgi:hypothetical protein